MGSGSMPFKIIGYTSKDITKRTGTISSAGPFCSFI